MKMPENEDLQHTNHRIDLLQTKTEADMKTLQASMEALQAKNEASNERLRTDIERGFSRAVITVTTIMLVAFGVSVTIIGLLIRSQ